VTTYLVNEIFFSLQGEGVRVGTPALFLRFARCNQQCTVETHGFDCDTDFDTGEKMTLDQIITALHDVGTSCQWVILTGGEPALQVDRELIDGLHEAGYKLAVETNGTIELPEGIDWITVSPKTPEDSIRQRTADEVKYVRTKGQPIPETTVDAKHKLISPAFSGNAVDDDTLQWCIQLVKKDPDWRLSVQQHKAWRIR
jgi:organic radical activating enzyme